MVNEVNVHTLVKGDELYIFLFGDDQRSEALRALGRFAANPDLSFSWYDAAVLSQRIRQGGEQKLPVAQEETKVVKETKVVNRIASLR